VPINTSKDFIHHYLFDIGFDSRLNPFKEREDDVDQPMNTSKDPLHIPNSPMTQFKKRH
jgi:hypothetical protein